MRTRSLPPNAARVYLETLTLLFYLLRFGAHGPSAVEMQDNLRCGPFLSERRSLSWMIAVRAGVLLRRRALLSGSPAEAPVPFQTRSPPDTYRAPDPSSDLKDLGEGRR